MSPTAFEREAVVEFLAGRPQHTIELLTRAHNAAVADGDATSAARTAFWIAFTLIGIGDRARTSGWIARARRLLEEHRLDCVENGYVLLPQAIDLAATGDLASAESLFADADRIGCRFNDVDLCSLARQGRGRALVGLGQTAEGVALFDEVMVAATAGELQPLIAGVVYCSVISVCFDLCDLRRAQEWTAALDEWLAAQPNMIPYRGECLAHRAEIHRLHGRWPEALDEARRACEALANGRPQARGAALYEVAELQRLRGDFAEAEDSYRQASDSGRSPQPGLALLRLAQGQREAARAAIARVLAESAHGRQRCEVTAAAVEILIACGDLLAARGAADELKAIADAMASPLVEAMAAYADGHVHLADADPQAALGSLRRALAIWRELESPYEVARTTALIGRACRALGDADGARMEMDAAIRALRTLGALPDVTRLEKPAEHDDVPAASTGGLTARELEVLRLIARGKTNRAIATELTISEKTVARHLSNIFTKLDLSTRSAATAYAFTHRLVDR